MMLCVNEEFEGVVEKCIFGGKGLLRHSSGMFVQVAEVLPAEKVLVRVRKLYKNYAEAVLVRVVEPSTDRIVPKCCHFGVCGGCQLQHMTYQRQTECKHLWLQEAFRGLIDSSIGVQWSPSTVIWNWRKKVVLHAYRSEDGDVVLGYFGREGISDMAVFQCHECPIFFAHEEQSVLDAIRETLGLLLRWKKGDVALFRRPSGRISVQFRLDKVPVGVQEARLLLASCRYIEEATLYVRSEKKLVLVESKVKKHLTLDFHGLRFAYSEKSFVQTHPEQPFHLWDDFCTYVQTMPKSISMLDLYSGIGVTATLASQFGHAVTAVEISQKACDACRDTALRYNLKSLQVVCSSVERHLPLAQTVHSIVLNPPRQGVSKEVLQGLKCCQAQELHYISCQPATLRRDLTHLVCEGWNIVWAKGYDMFPQTTHFETYVRLRRS